MDWIERWLGYSPDNGDGSLEILITVSLVIAVICVGLATHPAFRAILKRIGRGLEFALGRRGRRRDPEGEGSPESVERT